MVEQSRGQISQWINANKQQQKQIGDGDGKKQRGVNFRNEALAKEIQM